MADIKPVNARLGTIEDVEVLLANHFARLPSRDTLRVWLSQWRVRKFKANATAKRGGGPVYFYLADVERALKSRLMPG